MMDFDEWWIWYRGFGAQDSKDGFRDAFNAGVEFEKTRCRYPECVENEDGTCHRWMTEECPGPEELGRGKEQ